MTTERAELLAKAIEQWKALPDDERNGERPYIFGFNAPSLPRR